MISASKLAMLALLAAIAGCGGGGGGGTQTGDGTSAPPQPELANTRAFVDASPYSQLLSGCIAASEQSESCTLQTLPLIGLEHGDPDIAAVMNRVVVSHDWMGQRFEAVLGQLPADILTLLKGVTAVVIDDDIRPSFYTTLTGAIYLDPANLWLTNAEKATISRAADFRSGFGDELAFRSLWRYVLNDRRAYRYYPLDGDEERGLADIVYPLASLLYHELAHANDFFPPHLLGGVDTAQTVAAAAQSLSSERVARQLQQQMGLRSDTLFGLAGVMFRGDTPTAEQRALTAQQVGQYFAGDGASDDYAYSSIYEDVAMLFEEAMMKYHFDVDRDMAFTAAPADPSACGDYIVGWGNRNRLGDSEVKNRARFVVGELLPQADLDDFFQNLPLPTEMTVGVDWCQNIALSGPAAQSRAAGRADSGGDRPFDRDQLLRHH